MPDSNPWTKTALIKKLTNEEGTLEEAENWLVQLRALDPYVDMSDRMLYLEAQVKSRRVVAESKTTNLSKKELIALVRKVRLSEGSDVEIHAWLEILERNVPHPGVSDLIFYPQIEMTDQEIVETALDYKPILL